MEPALRSASKYPEATLFNLEPQSPHLENGDGNTYQTLYEISSNIVHTA